MFVVLSVYNRLFCLYDTFGLQTLIDLNEKVGGCTFYQNALRSAIALKTN